MHVMLTSHLPCVDGSWSTYNPEPSKKPEANILNSNKANVREELKYSKKDIEAVEEWVRRHVESTWHCLGVSICPCSRGSIQRGF